MENEKKQPILKEEELFDLVRKLIRRRRFLWLATAIFFVLGIVAAFTGIKKYSVSVEVAPETGSSSLGGTIGSLASMAGFDLGSMAAGNDAIYPLLYPDIIESLPFLTGLFDVHVESLDGKVNGTYLDYRNNFHRKSIGDKLKEAPKKWAKKFAALFIKKQPFLGNPEVMDPYYLSEYQMTLVEGLKKDLHVNVDKKTDVITIGFTAQEPKVAAIMADSVTARLQAAITQYRTHKAQNDYAYFERLCQKAQCEYEEAQMAYATYQDRNMDIIRERSRMESDRLQADMDLKNTLYMQWAQQLQLAAAKVQESTPAFTVLKPAAIPALPSSRRKLATILLWTVMGFLLSSVWVLIKEPLQQVIRKIRG